VVVFAVLSLLGLKEYRTLARKKISGEAPWWCAYAAVPIHYLLLYFGWFAPYWTFIPIWVLLALLIRLAARGRTRDFLETVGIMFLGLMLIVFLFSHAALVLRLPASLNPVAGAEGLLIYLIVLTELNDIAQALIGRRFGSRKIASKVSPNKTWEGFLGGMATTLLTAVLLAPLLTPFRDAAPALGQIGFNIPYLMAVAVGVLIAVGGFLGDIAVSAIKREVGVKDSGDVLPGQGGILDRIDSLIFTAPLFFYFTFVLYD
jgi:phosphatidate cytidylyltransferase